MNDFALTNPENPDLCDFSKSQWYTPPELAERIALWAQKPFDSTQSLYVLEPSAGRGALAIQMMKLGHAVTAVEIAKDNCEALRWLGLHDLIQSDFLSQKGLPRFDLAVMNPPFEEGQTEAHVLHALQFARRVVCHCPLTTLAGRDRREGLWSIGYLRRLVIHSARPKYSGSRTGGMTDMCTIDVVRRFDRAAVAASDVEVEWW